MFLIKRSWLTGLLFSVLVACTPVREWNPLDYSVKPGDTLYSIAWRYELDFQDIASWNNIASPYAIYPGQRLRLSADDRSGSFGHDTLVADQSAMAAKEDVTEVDVTVVDESAPDEVVTDRALTVVVRKGDTLYMIAKNNGLSHRQIARWNALHPPYRLRVGQTLRLTPPTDRYAGGSATNATPSKPPAGKLPAQPNVRMSSAQKKSVVGNVALAAVTAWHWPVKGRIIKTFKPDDTSRKGIVIAGKSGQPILAAAGGRVVYSGNGLISYGNLIIIKHDDNYLSAYAHNEELLVSEGDDVRADQLIARMGQNNGRAQLHFEIRKKGKPVNPLQYLPQG
jgi:lipoprotein NlpD